MRILTQVRSPLMDKYTTCSRAPRHIGARKGSKTRLEVSYAVSEKENGFDDVVKGDKGDRCDGVTGRQGNGLHWAILGSTRVFWAILGCSRL